MMIVILNSQADDTIETLSRPHRYITLKPNAQKDVYKIYVMFEEKC